MKNRPVILIVFFAVFTTTVYPQLVDVGFGLQFYQIKGQRIISNSTTATMPSFFKRAMDDTYPLTGISVGAYVPFKEYLEKRTSFGVFPNFNFALGIGKYPNSDGYNGTYFYAFQSQLYAGVKWGEDALSNMYNKRLARLGLGFGAGAQLSSGITDYYVNELKYTNVVPSVMGDITVNTGYRGLTLKFKIYYSFRHKTVYQSYTGDIPWITYNQYGIIISKVFSTHIIPVKAKAKTKAKTE